MLTFSELETFKTRLEGFWEPGEERCGIVDLNLEIVEVQNRAEDPENTFAFQLEDLENGAKATWHTHPSTSANLSIPDYRFFQSWPEMLHFIVGAEEVRCYQVLDGIVYCVEDEEDYSPRESEEALQ